MITFNDCIKSKQKSLCICEFHCFQNILNWHKCTCKINPGTQNKEFFEIETTDKNRFPEILAFNGGNKTLLQKCLDKELSETSSIKCQVEKEKNIDPSQSNITCLRFKLDSLPDKNSQYQDRAFKTFYSV